MVGGPLDWNSIRPVRQPRPATNEGARMLRRGLLVGGLGLSLTLTGAGLVNQAPAFAQESSTSTPADSTTTATATDSRAAARAEWEAERLAQYENFLAKFAANLGLSDPALVETAYKDTLKELIDEQLAAGDIAANDAAELKTRIDEADGPLFFGGGRGDRMIGIGGGPGGHDMRGGRGGGRGDNRPPGVGGATEDEADDDSGVESLPATEEAESTPSA